MTDDTTILALEKQISDEREKLSADRMDISFGELMNMYSSDELIIRPEYQRLFRWSNMQKTSLIESILLGIPIPPIFVAEDEDGVWELVDGLQRISTILSFFGNLKDENNSLNYTECTDDMDVEDLEEVYEDEPSSNLNKWILDAGSIIKELEGFNVDTFPKKYLLNIKRAVCRVEILRGKSNTSMKYELFKRLNSGGSKLTAQEIRNAIYRGIDPSINLLIEELSKNQTFEDLTRLSLRKKQELYDQELILRFIAFYNNSDSINSNTEAFLDEFMQNAVDKHNFNREKYKDLFNSVMDLISQIDDDMIFRNNRNAFVPALFEGITIGTAQQLDFYKTRIPLLKEKIELLKGDEEFKRASGTASNSKNRVKKRLTRVGQIFNGKEE